MRKTTTMHERIATRAYFAALNDGHKRSPLTYWLHAEAWERQAGIAKRAAAAAKASATRRVKAATKAPAEMLVAATGRLPTRRLTAH